MQNNVKISRIDKIIRTVVVSVVLLILFVISTLAAALPATKDYNETDPELLSKINTGDTAWMLIASALVLIMTPGVAFFYGYINVIAYIYLISLI